MTLSLRARLLLAVVLLVLFGLVVADIATYAALRSYMVQRVDDQLRSTGPNAASLLNEPGMPGPGGDHHGGPGGPSRDLPTGTYVALFTPQASLITEKTIYVTAPATTNAKPNLPKTLPNAGPDVITLLDATGSDGTPYRVMVESLDQAGGDFLVVAVPLSDVQSTLSGLLSLEGLIGSAVLLASAALALWIVRSGLRPLDRMGDTAAAIAAGDLGRRVSPATSQTEIGRLGLALNAMLAQIEEAFDERTRTENRLRRFIASASHELRTPLTSIRGYSELLRRRPNLPKSEVESAHHRIEDEAIRMGVLVDDLLLLARLDQGRPLDRQPVDLRGILHDASGDVAVTAPDRQLTVEAPDPVVVYGDDLRLRQVVGNLVRNAVVHTPPETPVEVSLAQENGHALLTVTDHGPGLSEDERRRVFEPFYRADPGRSRDRGGSGLGLSIVAAVVAAHGGKVEARPTDGGGATFRVELPLAAS